MEKGNSELDIESITRDCGLNNPDLKLTDIIKNITAIPELYSNTDTVKIYNYFLSECKNPTILQEIIRLEDRYRDKTTVPVLIDILLGKTISLEEENSDTLINLRVLSAKAIANIKDTTAVHALLHCLNNKNENYKVRFACADALGKIGDKYAVAPLIEVVKDEDEKSIYLRESAASALGQLGDKRAIDSLVGILETRNGLIDKFTFLKERVLEALGKLEATKDKRVFKALKNSLQDESSQIRINAIEALMESETDEAYELVLNCLFDNDEEVKRNALIAAYNMRGRHILDEIIEDKKYDTFLKEEAKELINEYEKEDINEK